MSGGVNGSGATTHSFLDSFQLATHNLQAALATVFPVETRVMMFSATGRIFQGGALVMGAGSTAVALTKDARGWGGLLPAVIAGIFGTLLVSNSKAAAEGVSNALYIPRPFVAGQPVGLIPGDPTNDWVVAALQLVFLTSPTVRTNTDDIGLGDTFTRYTAAQRAKMRQTAALSVQDVREYLFGMSNEQISKRDKREDVALVFGYIPGLDYSPHQLVFKTTGKAPEDDGRVLIVVPIDSAGSQILFARQFPLAFEEFGGRLQFKVLPQEMFLHVDRFPDPDRARNDDDIVSADRISIPATLVENGTTGDYVCDGFIVHSGDTLKGGHYYAVIYASHLWWLCDGPRVTEIPTSEAMIHLKKAYILHYRTTVEATV